MRTEKIKINADMKIIIEKEIFIIMFETFMLVDSCDMENKIK